ncbi:TonB-dependent receptor [Spongiibacter sp. KMU-158]|uniref:TonB-dependent receptor n=1 Tax=Spongiibacter pelagi TaxID=2760804 RepID=A0A927GV62_9GAMM|nr:TonB-dependent receptor [Spongiibacter pelagi]MBD2857733.1 TonB-dependent receptor [Spongiibacter pelagi]
MKKIINLTSKTLLIGGLALSFDAEAQTPAASGKRVLEEVIVTAQKREQSVHDVPISMTALTGDFLKEQGVTDITEALQLVPNASIDAAGFFAAPRVRGFTFNNNNKSFEPPVGMAIDGIPHTRIPYFLAALFDIQRMEVLRGPQGTSFGKNTTAGLIHVISNKPTTEYEGSLTLENGELDRHRLEAAFGGPIVSGFNFRIAGLYDERDGFIKNTTAEVNPEADPRLKSRERSGLRATFEFEDIIGTRLELGIEHFELYDGGAALETVSAGPNFTAALRRYDPKADVTPGNWVTSIDLPDYRDITIDRYRLLWEIPLADWSATFIAAHAIMDQELSLDTDFTPAEALNGSGGDHSPMSYGELRFTAPTYEGFFGLGKQGSSDVLFGATWSKRQILDSEFNFRLNSGPFIDLLQAAALDANGVPSNPLIDALLGALPLNGIGEGSEQMNQFFEQTATAQSLYGHAKWQFTETWGIELGARYTQEKKEGDWNVHFTTPPPNAVLSLVGAQEFTAHREREESNLQPKISLNWQPNDALSIFLHAERGFKGGGFNAFAFREGTNDIGFESDDLVFDEEIAKNIGLDFKIWLFDNTANLNISLFRQSAEDFQVLIRENPPGTIGLGTSRVVNAEEAYSQGLEADFLWLANSWLTVNASLGLLDTEFVKFLDGECPVGQTDPDDGDPDNPRCNQSGKSFPFAPKYSGSLALRVNKPLEFLGGLALTAGVLMEFEDDQLLDVDLDEAKRQAAFERYKADIGLRDIEREWSLRLVVENLDNTPTHIRYGDVFEGVIVGSQRQPRLAYLQFKKDF